MYALAVLLAAVLSDILTILADTIGLPSGYWMVVIGGPSLVFGACLWWLLIERRAAYTYRLGGTFGLLTALLTGLLWTGRFVMVWGFEMLAVRMVYLLVLLVLGIVALVGLLVGVLFMGSRRRFGPNPTGRREG